MIRRIFNATRKYPYVPPVGKDLDSHSTALAAVREAVEIHERRTSDLLNSFVRVSEMIELGLFEIKGGKIVIVPTSSAGGATDHGALTGLGDNDHPQYLTQAEGDALYDPLGSGTSDHGALTGLADDDHTQYHTDARGDARYSLLAHNHDHGALTGLADDDHPQYPQIAGTEVITGSWVFQNVALLFQHTGTADPSDYGSVHFDAAGSLFIRARDDSAAATRNALIYNPTTDSMTIGDSIATAIGLGGTVTITNAFHVGNADTTVQRGAAGELDVEGDRIWNQGNLGTQINALTADATPDAAADYVVTRDATDGSAKKVLLEDLPSGVTDHGALTGLADDDHTQYHTDARGDARYSLLAHNHDHGTLTGLADDDHPQYPQIAGTEVITGSWVFQNVALLFQHTGAADPSDYGSVHFDAAGSLFIRARDDSAAATRNALIYNPTTDTLTIGDSISTAVGLGGTVTVTNPFHVANADTTIQRGAAGEIDVEGDRVWNQGNIGTQINALTADATPDGAADYVATYDASAGVAKKVLLNNLPGGGVTDHGALTGLADDDHSQYPQIAGTEVITGSWVFQNVALLFQHTGAADPDDYGSIHFDAAGSLFIRARDDSAAATRNALIYNPTTDTLTIGDSISTAVGLGGTVTVTNPFHVANADTTIQRGAAGEIDVEGDRVWNQGNIGTQLDALAADTAPDRLADYLATYDASAGAAKKTLLKYISPWNTLIQTADDSKTNNTLASSTYLTVALAASTRYTIRGVAYILVQDAAADARFDINYSGSWTTVYCRDSRNVAGVAAGTDARTDRMASALPGSTDMTATVTGICVVQFEITGLTNASGTLSFRFAQVTNSATPTLLKAGSYMEYMVAA